MLGPVYYKRSLFDEVSGLHEMTSYLVIGYDEFPSKMDKSVVESITHVK